MILSRRVSLGGVQLDSLDNSIVIKSVDPGVPHESVNAVNRMGGFGQRMTRHHWETLEVSVKFAIDLPKTQMIARRAVFDKIIKWAIGGGWLTTNQMNGKRMYAEKAVIPSGGDMREWMSEYTIIFRAYGVPFWQDATATADVSGVLTVPGILRTVCDAEIANGGSSTIDSLTVTAGNSTMEFSELGLAAGETLKIGHGNDGVLWLRIYSNNTYRSVLDKRTGGSADDLYVDPGVRSVSASSGTASFSCYGRYA